MYASEAAQILSVFTGILGSTLSAGAALQAHGCPFVVPGICARVTIRICSTPPLPILRTRLQVRPTCA